MKPRTKERLLTGAAVLLIAAGGFVLPGCSATPYCKGDMECELLHGTAYHFEYEHISHLSAGPPFGQREEEDSLNHVSACATRLLVAEMGVEGTLCVGYRLTDGGFYGPDDTTAFRIKVPLNKRTNW